MSILQGLRVLDLSRVLAGPWASQLLADFGAEVIKVENPAGGDDTRSWGPPFTAGDEGQSAYFLCANRGKRSVTIDLKSPDGQAAVRKLAVESDILLENFKVGRAERLGIDYPRLHRINPRLIYCSITGFGQTGPCRDRPGYDLLVQAMGGLMSITGERDDLAGGRPQKVGVAVSDIMTGLYATVGILAALHERQASGRGQHIDLALLDVTVASLANQASNYLVGGVVPRRLGNAHPSIVLYQAFATRDGYIVLAVGNDTQFRRLARLLGKPELAEDPRYATNPARVANRDALLAILEPLLSLRPSEHWLRDLSADGTPAGPINDMQGVFEDPQLRARDMVVSIERADGDKLELVGNPLKFSRTPVRYDRPAPLLGEHNKEILDPGKRAEPSQP